MGGGALGVMATPRPGPTSMTDNTCTSGTLFVPFGPVGVVASAAERPAVGEQGTDDADLQGSDYAQQVRDRRGTRQVFQMTRKQLTWRG